jgi:hypothetical protein
MGPPSVATAEVMFTFSTPDRVTKGVAAAANVAFKLSTPAPPVTVSAVVKVVSVAMMVSLADVPVIESTPVVSGQIQIFVTC